MKVQAILEFELEDWAAVPVVGRETLDLAAEDTDHAIRSRLIGEGFLDADALVRTGTLRVSIRDGPSEPDPPDWRRSPYPHCNLAKPGRRAGFSRLYRRT